METYKITAKVEGKTWLSKGTALKAINEQDAIGKAKVYLPLKEGEDYAFTVTPIIVHKLGDKIQVDNYPYGRLRATAFFSVEYQNKKGARSIFQTINPKTGRLNAEKKSTYSPVLLNYTDNMGFVGTIGTGFNGHEEINSGLHFMEDFKEYFSPAQITDISAVILMYLKVDIKAQVVYCGSEFEILKPLYDPAIKNIMEIYKGVHTEFKASLLDIPSIEAAKVPDYQPFKVVNYGI